MKKGDLIKYKTDFNGFKYIGIVLETIGGFHIRKTWSDNKRFIKKNMVRVFWLNRPDSMPISAGKQMMLESWPLSGPSSTGLLENTVNTIVDEWEKLTEESNWFFSEHFILLEENNDDIETL